MRLSQLLSASDRGVLCTSAVAVLLGLCICSAVLPAQVLTGVVRLRDSEAVVPRARLVAQDRQGRELGVAVSDGTGHYFLSVPGKIDVPFRVTVSRIGMKPSLSDEITLTNADTVSATFWVQEEVATEVEALEATATVSLNSQRYNTAKRRGWRVIEPVEIEQRANASLGLNELVRSLGLPGLIVPQRNGDCIRSVRSGNRCLPIIMDGVLIGTNVHLNPRDIYFIALVGSSEARAEWGDRAAFGAVAIYTRMNGDIMKPMR